MRKLLLLACLCFAGQASAITYNYVNQGCALNGNGAVNPDGVAGGCAAVVSQAGAWNTYASVTPTRGFTTTICGNYTGQVSVSGISGGDGLTQWVLEGNCPAIGRGKIIYDDNVSHANLVSIGGSNRSNIWVQNLALSGGVTGIFFNGSATTATNLKVLGNFCDGHSVACVGISPIKAQSINGIEVAYNTCQNIGTADTDGTGPITPLGACVYVAPEDQEAAGSPGVVTALLVHDNHCWGHPTKGRYCIMFYPPNDQEAGPGQIRASKIYNNDIHGPYLYSFIDIVNDADDTEVYGGTYFGTCGGACIHTSGQAAGGAAPDNTWVHDIDMGEGHAVANTWNPADAGGFFPDDNSGPGIWERLSTHGNVVAGFYINAADSQVVRYVTTWDNGDNCVNVHGLSGLNLFSHISCAHKGNRPSGFAPQGLDAFQFDANVEAGNSVTDSVVDGRGLAKCIDADTTITEHHNTLYGCSDAVEGQADGTGTDQLDPKFLRGQDALTTLDMRLGSGSGAATTATTVGPATDMRGCRNDPGAPSRGAYAACGGDASATRTSAH